MTAASGIGLRSAHYRDFLDANFFVDDSVAHAAPGFVEVHSENFFGRGDAPLRGVPRQLLERVRSEFALSLHGIGLSLGAAQLPQNTHLQQLKWLVDDFDPLFVSDHLAWVGIDDVYANDLLPLPYTEESLQVIVDNIDAVQNYLERTLLLENPSRYLDFSHSTIAESEFLNAVARRTGCGILLDVNNVFVSASNLGFDARAYIAAIDPEAVREIHLAGFSQSSGESGNWLIDTHNHPVDERVWQLYAYALERLGDKPTLIEWDADLPALHILLDEKNKADAMRAAQTLTVEANHAVPA
jgi:uncharacterized protein (UPF0276 family)